MPRKSKTDQDIGFMRSFWDEVREMQVDYGVLVTVAIYPSSRTGVFVFRMVGAQMPSRTIAEIGTHSVQFEYPKGDLQSLPGALWMRAFELHHMVDEAFRTAAAQSKLPF